MTTYTTADLAIDLLQAGGWLLVFACVLWVGVMLVSKFLHGARTDRR